MAAPLRDWAANLRHFWFHALEPRDWWGGSAKVDAHLKQHYERWLVALQNQRPDTFMDDPATALAAILLFDQAPRNLYGGTARAFAFDPLARQLTYRLVARGWDRLLTPVERQFAGLPLMHSEHIADQRASLAWFTALGPRYGLGFARDHYRMVARFGRFPHRNKALGRKSTAAEVRAVEEGFSW